MTVLLVVDRPERWSLDIPGVEVVAARAYVGDRAYSDLRRAKVFNLCRSYAYQSLGYYVSMLAEARGHVPQPSVSTIRDFSQAAIVRLAAEDLDKLIQRTLKPVRADRFELSIYFGRPLAQRDVRLAAALHELFPAPLLRARFRRDEEEGWRMTRIAPISTSEISSDHFPAVVESATRYFARSRSRPRKRTTRWDLALLVDEAERSPPSDERALARFERAATSAGLAVERLTREDYASLAEFDALFIRTTTGVDHWTYRFARRAEALGLAVIDAPLSIVRCANKVYLAELLERHGLRTPRTMIVHSDNRDELVERIGLPCVLKQPDGAFSLGVKRANDVESLDEILRSFLADSDLVIAQEYLPTEFDWRIGLLDRQPLYACRYFMAGGHWQIMEHDGKGAIRSGKVETLAVEDAPPAVVRAAKRAADLIGDGLYGVDLKQIGKRVVVIEVNDNPNLDAGYEDKVLGKELWRRIAESFVRRIERGKEIVRS